MVYVIDASSFIEIEEVCAADGFAFDLVLARMTDLCSGCDLTFPPLVVRDCRDLAETDIITSWVRSSAAGLQNNSPGYELTGEVLGKCPSVFDPDDDRESAEVEVLALALSHLDAGSAVTVVTAQWIDSPSRQALGNAARVMGLSSLDTVAFVRAIMR